MFEKLGKRALAIPLVVPVVLVCMFSLMFYPMARMELKGLPFAVVCLDEGIDMPTGHVNAGEAMVEQLTDPDAGGVEEEADSESTEGGSLMSADAVSWVEYGSQEELDAAFDAGEIYGAIVIPENFTLSQAAQDVGEANLRVYLDKAKSPLIATQLQSGMSLMLARLGVGADVEVINDGGYADEDASPMSGMLLLQVSLLPLVLGSAVGALVLSRALRLGEGRRGRFAKLAQQLGVMVVASGVMALCAYAAVIVVVGAEIPLATSVLFMWLAGFCVMLLVCGAADVHLALGVSVVLLVMGLGNMTGVLPYETLPAFWQDWVYPWAPQRFIGDGLREVFYRGFGVLNAGTAGVATIGAVGLALGCLAALLPRGKKA